MVVLLLPCKQHTIAGVTSSRLPLITPAMRLYEQDPTLGLCEHGAGGVGGGSVVCR